MENQSLYVNYSNSNLLKNATNRAQRHHSKTPSKKQGISMFMGNVSAIDSNLLISERVKFPEACFAIANMKYWRHE